MPGRTEAGTGSIQVTKGLGSVDRLPIDDVGPSEPIRVCIDPHAAEFCTRERKRRRKVDHDGTDEQAPADERHR